jgi:hypothetical protein
MYLRVSEISEILVILVVTEIKRRNFLNIFGSSSNIFQIYPTFFLNSTKFDTEKTEIFNEKL